MMDDYNKMQIFHIARFVLECRTPLSIATGSEGVGHDTELTRDANGIPALPGTALAGVLRHLYGREYGEVDLLFGYQQGDNGSASRVNVAWGALLDSRGNPVEGLLLGSAARRLADDPVLKAVMASRTLPDLRDRVRLDHRGSAVSAGKFDRTILPAGHRFACEISLNSAQLDDECWSRLLGLFRHRLFRLGGATRAGLGAFELVSLHAASWDLTDAAHVEAFRTLGSSIGDTTGLNAVEATQPETTQSGLRAGELRLRPRHFWRIGQGKTPLKASAERTPDLLPKLETRLIWEAGRPAQVQQDAVIVPGSAIKGALAHRVAFHANRLSGRYAEDMQHWESNTPKLPSEVLELFGEAADKADEAGHAGRIFIDDIFLEPEGFRTDASVLTHNVIDRFSGGVRNRMLFSEEMLWQGELRIPITIDEEGLSESAKAAFLAALEDLCSGRLAIGGGVSRGHGFCEGKLEWHIGNGGDEE